MGKLSWLTTALILGTASGCGPTLADGRATQTTEQNREENGLDVLGKTQPAPGYSATIAPVPLHPVERVYVKAGDRVKKNQPLVEIDPDEAKADVRAKEAYVIELQKGLARLKAQRLHDRVEAEASLESASVHAAQAGHIHEQLEPLWKKGSVPDLRFREAHDALLRARADERAAAARLKRYHKEPVELEIAEIDARIAAAQAAVESSKAELEHYTVMAPIDGVVSWLEVNLGTVSRPGTTVWGEILDLSVIDARCELSPTQADHLVVGQPATITRDESPGVSWIGQVTFIGIAADAQTGRVPVLVRIANPVPSLRARIPVKVRFGKK